MVINEEKVNIELGTTKLENLFVTKYMKDLSSREIKIYLYLLLLSQNKDFHDTDIKNFFELDEESLNIILKGLEDKGLLSINEGSMSLKSLRNKLVSAEETVVMEGNTNLNEREKLLKDQGTIKEAQADDKPLSNVQIKEILDEVEAILGRTLPPSDAKEIISWSGDKYPRELIVGCYRYCESKLKTNISYIKKVMDNWYEEGIRNKEDIEEYIKNTEERGKQYKRIFKEIGRSRAATMAEKKLMNKWLDEDGFSLEKILECCNKSGFKESIDLRYIDKVLENWKKKAEDRGIDINGKEPVSLDVLNKYYEYLQQQAVKEAEARRREVYEKIPELEKVDTSLKELNGTVFVAISQGKQDQVLKLRKEIQNLNTKRAVLLTDNNFNIDYTDVMYKCKNCKDTGLDDNGRRCSCTKDRMGEADIWQRTAL